MGIDDKRIPLRTATAGVLARSSFAASTKVTFSGDATLECHAYDRDISRFGILDATTEHVFEGSSFGFGAKYTLDTGFGLAAHAEQQNGDDASYSADLTFDF